jgi:hypothetical protein
MLLAFRSFHLKYHMIKNHLMHWMQEQFCPGPELHNFHFVCSSVQVCFIPFYSCNLPGVRWQHGQEYRAPSLPQPPIHSSLYSHKPGHMASCYCPESRTNRLSTHRRLWAWFYASQSAVPVW